MGFKTARKWVEGFSPEIAMTVGMMLNTLDKLAEPEIETKSVCKSCFNASNFIDKESVTLLIEDIEGYRCSGINIQCKKLRELLDIPREGEK